MRATRKYATAPRTDDPKTPTSVGAEIKATLLKRHPSIAAAARAANMPEGTMRRWIFGNPTGLDSDTIVRFATVGVTHETLRRALDEGRKAHQSRT